ncbi:MAG: hypothetical protein RI920_1181, partial [Pseudomonadota bacterium]
TAGTIPHGMAGQGIRASQATSSTPPALPVPHDLPGAPELPLLTPTGPQAHRYQRRSLQLDAARWATLRRLARGLGVTPAMLLLRAYGEVLGLFAREPRFTLMLTLFNRPALHPQVDQVVGDFTAVLPLAMDLREGDFAQAVRRTQAEFLSAMDAQGPAPHEAGLAAQREHRRLHSASALPLSAFVFTCLLRDEPDSRWLGEPLALLSQTPQVWLDHQLLERDGELHVAWDAREACFPAGLLDQMFAVWKRMLYTLADQARTGLPLTPHGPRADGHSALLPAGRTPSLMDRGESPEPPREALHAPFLRQAALQAQAPALRSTDRVIRYGELAERSAQLARALLAAGARPDSLVGIVMDKGWEQVVAALGITRSGAAYLPIDAELPPARIAQLIQRGDVRCVVIQAGHPVRAQLPSGLTVIEISGDGLTLPSSLNLDLHAALPDVHPDSLAYVIFTSGSTGEPKGVAMAHAATLNTVLDINARGAVDSRDVVLALSALNFDLSVWDIFGTLAAGACIAMPDPEMRRDTAQLLDFARQAEVSIVNAVPALVQLMVEAAEGGRHALPPALRWVLMSGDWIPVSLPDRLRALRPAAQMLAMGGATEAAIWSNSFSIEAVDPDWPSIPYGRALRHQQMVVLDQAGHPRPTWVPGEIHIGGVGLAQGYWRDRATTASRFVTHPHTGQRLYRTGDLGRHLPSGDIEFLGRMDHQVKVAGHRIEPGEIEHQARQVNGVCDALVMVHREGGGARLLGFAVRTPEAASSSDIELREAIQVQLQQHLPSYMQPSAWVVRPAWPLSPNGKVDRAALISQWQALATQFDKLDNEAATLTPGSSLARVHSLLRQTWSLDALPLHVSFLDLGLNSIDLMRGANALGQHLGVRPAIHQLFDHPTVNDVAALCDRLLAAEPANAGATQDVTPTAPCLPAAAWGPLTPSQHSLWLLEQMHPEAAAYNEPMALRLTGELNVGALQGALLDIVRRHDALRMVFAMHDGQAMQRPRPQDDCSCHPTWQSFSLPDLHDEAALSRLLQPWAHQPFDLSGGALLRVALVHSHHPGKQPEHVLVMVAHHIVSDHWSLSVLNQELAWLYASRLGLPGTGEDSLPSLSLNFSTFAWQAHERAHAPAQQATRAADLAHWQTALTEPLPVLDLPTDRPRGASFDAGAGTLPFTVPAEALPGLRELARQHGSTLHVVLMAAYALLLSRHSGQAEVCLGTVTAQRDRPELEPLIGYMVDSLPLRCHVDPMARFDQLLAPLHSQMQAARAHASLSFVELVEALQPRRHAGRTPVFQTMFVLQNTPPIDLNVAGLHATTLELGLARAKFDLVLEVADHSRPSAHGQALPLHAAFTYATALFDASTIISLAEQYQHLLRAVSGSLGADAARLPSHALPLLDAQQRAQMLRSWSGADEALAFTRMHPGLGSDGTLLATLVQHARHTPQALALAFEDGTHLTHAELAAQSNALARQLLQAGAQPGQLVGLHLQRSLAMMVSVVAIWKAGCAYLPLDPSYPSERLALMADDAQLQWVISDMPGASDLWPASVLRLDGPALWHSARQASANPSQTQQPTPHPIDLPAVTGDDVAYVIYTSGSTGRPKGTVVRHRGLWQLGLATAQ